LAERCLDSCAARLPDVQHVDRLPAEQCVPNLMRAAAHPKHSAFDSASRKRPVTWRIGQLGISMQR
jgi:hypothetical protein